MLIVVVMVVVDGGAVNGGGEVVVVVIVVLGVMVVGVGYVWWCSGSGSGGDSRCKGGSC